jgi:hypothetical protein
VTVGTGLLAVLIKALKLESDGPNAVNKQTHRLFHFIRMNSREHKKNNFKQYQANFAWQD